jgi:V/A-type H+-transporting ATPase subunit I
MIEKMSFVTLAGPKTQIDYLVDNYLSKHDIHLENALTEFSTSEQFTNFSEENPFKASLNKSHELMQLVSHPENALLSDISVVEAEKFLERIDDELIDVRTQISDLREKVDSLNVDYATLAPFKTLNYTLEKIYNMEFFKYRFGKIPRSGFDKFESYLDPDIDAIFVSTLHEAEFVYGVFFAPTDYFEDVEKDFRNIHFDKIDIPGKYKGFPNDECLKIAGEISDIEDEISEKQNEINAIIENHKDRLVSAVRRIETAYSNFDVRKYAAVTRDSGITFQVLCGWMTSKEAKKLYKETNNDQNVICIVSENVEDHKTTPPTKLKNFKLIKPFEMFVRMYGLPAYNEFDPTLFLTITYAFIFGIMFGDLGQGLCLFIGGALLYKLKKIDLAGIVCAAGFFSCIFGALFGSFFGFEFDSLISPLNSMITLPFLGNINIVLVAAFLFGSFVILSTMILNIANAIKQKNLGKALFGPNALTGFIFYLCVIVVIILYMTGKPLPGTILLIIMFVVPLILIFLEEPLKNILAKKKPIEDSPGIFAATAFFELFDYLITYLSNALSFLRIGVFAISHAAMMQVVMTLAGAENGGSANILVVIIGNIIVLAMEGLVVGIQVLRLEYYEIFGRFYEGSGREFIPYRKRK